MQQNQIKSAQKKAQKKAFLVISHKSAQNHTKSPHPAPHKACRFYQAARTPPRIDHYPTEVGDTGRYNFGQKCVFWAAIIFLVLLLVSGVIIWRPYFAPAFSIPVIRFALMLHSFAAVALIVVIMVHIYAALWVKGTITAMVEGWVTSAWAKKHHPRWYREVRKTTEKKAE